MIKGWNSKVVKILFYQNPILTDFSHLGQGSLIPFPGKNVQPWFKKADFSTSLGPDLQHCPTIGEMSLALTSIMPSLEDSSWHWPVSCRLQTKTSFRSNSQPCQILSCQKSIPSKSHQIYLRVHSVEFHEFFCHHSFFAWNYICESLSIKRYHFYNLTTGSEFCFC